MKKERKGRRGNGGGGGGTCTPATICKKKNIKQNQFANLNKCGKQIKIENQRYLIDYNTTKISIYIYTIIFIINGSLIFYYLGIPFFISGNRTISSYSELGSGFGILNYLNWGLQSILNILALKVWLFDKNKKLGISVLVMLVIFNMLNGGGKGAYLSLLMALNLGMY